MWYCRHEIQLPQPLFFSAASITGAFSGLIASSIAKMDGAADLEGWRWIFLLEGIATVVVAVIAFFVLHDFPETATFLTEEERAFVVFRLKYQGQVQAKEQTRTQVAQAEEFGVDIVCPLYGISLFLPTIIRNLGYSSSKAQLMTVPIYITAAILAVFFAYRSDRLGKRSPFVVFFLLMMIVGFSMCIHVESASVYAGVAACAIYPAFPGVIASASNFYRLKDAPGYILGHALELAFIGAGVVAAVVLIAAYAAINQKRDRAMQEGERDRYTAKELSAKGDRAVTFRYMY
ncbi:hypothetical protein DL771_002264 [Monosporascus sp. 5C6A]|nr:hypothetical protein DL771_002264 [Monosporascus sp. 5C6A]